MVEVLSCDLARSVGKGVRAVSCGSHDTYEGHSTGSISKQLIDPRGGLIIGRIAPQILPGSADRADQARSACVRLAKAPSWITLPFPPVAAGAGSATSGFFISVAAAGSGFGSGFGRAIGVSDAALMLS